jgi:hypothetical protein
MQTNNKKRKSGLYALGISVLIILGCASCASSGPREVSSYSFAGGVYENESFSVKVLPTGSLGMWKKYGPEAFALQVENKTDSTLEIDWNRTLFMDNGQSRGGFMFEGIKYNDRNAAKSPDIVGPNSIFRKSIWPNVLVQRFTSSWSHFSFGWDKGDQGKYGVSLSVKKDGKEVRALVEGTLTKTTSFE